MNIQDLLYEQSLFFELGAADKDSCIQAMIDGLDAAGCLSNKAQYRETVMKREQAGSTGIGFGVAIPHGKSSGVSKPGLAFAKLASPLNWNSLDGNSVSVVFLIAVPDEAAGNEHLQILIALSRKLIDEQFRQSLIEAKDTRQLADILQTI